MEEAVQLLRGRQAALDPDAGGSYSSRDRLAFLSASAALDLDHLNFTAARLTAMLAEASYPYWLAWPESEQRLRPALGDRALSSFTQRVRERHASRWNAWQHQFSMSETLPPATAIISPFQTQVMIWDFAADELQRDELAALSASAVALYESIEFVCNAHAPGDCCQQRNEALFNLQNRWQQRHSGVSIFSDDEALQEAVKPTILTSGPRATSTFRRIDGLLRAASTRFLIRHGVDPPVAEAIATTRGMFAWIGVHAVDEGYHEEEIEAHPHHRHDLSAVSGVLYLHLSTDGRAEDGVEDERTYKGENAKPWVAEPLLLRFHDPRGERTVVDELPFSGNAREPVRATPVPRPPFLSELTVAAHRGRLVLFPPWLGHRVARSGSPDAMYAESMDTVGNERTRGEEEAQEAQEAQEEQEEQEEDEEEEEETETAKAMARASKWLDPFALLGELPQKTSDRSGGGGSGNSNSQTRAQGPGQQQRQRGVSPAVSESESESSVSVGGWSSGDAE